VSVTLAVGLVAALDEADAVLCELAEGVDHGVDGVHGGRARSPRRGARVRGDGRRKPTTVCFADGSFFYNCRVAFACVE
jgi:hypothetical protein